VPTCKSKTGAEELPSTTLCICARLHERCESVRFDAYLLSEISAFLISIVSITATTG